MLKKLINEGYGNDLSLNCAEKILYGSNKVYNLGLEREALKMAAGFGGGMTVESVCGALTGGIMVLGRLFKSEDKEKLKEIVKEFIEAYRQEMGEIDCTPLKDRYKTEDDGCHNIIVKAAEILEEIIDKEKNVPLK